MRVVIVSGLSGSGKSVALNVLEDKGFYCIDNIPVSLLGSFLEEVLQQQDLAFDRVAVGLDARNLPTDLAKIPELVSSLRDRGITCEVIFLKAADDILLSRFSETRRKHPLTNEKVSLRDAIAKERKLLQPVIDAAELVIDTTRTTVYGLREMVQQRVTGSADQELSILVESFGYKHGLPADADFVFDVRCLPNPYWEPRLRRLNGLDDAVIKFLNEAQSVQNMISDIAKFLDHWIPLYRDFQRSYLTVAIGCTGGQHRSVYVAEQLAEKLQDKHGAIQTRHNELG